MTPRRNRLTSTTELGRCQVGNREFTFDRLEHEGLPPSLRIRCSWPDARPDCYMDLPVGAIDDALAAVESFRRAVVGERGAGATTTRTARPWGTWTPTSGEPSRRPHVASERVEATQTDEDPDPTDDAASEPQEGR